MINKIGNKIGEGGCSEVFEWEDESKIVKVAKHNTSDAALQAELHACRIALECGLPVPQPFELVNIEGRSGIVFERIYGESLMKRFIDNLIDQPKQQPLKVFEDFADDDRITARLLFQIHTHSVPNMPGQRDHIKHNILLAQYLTEDEKAAVITQMDQIPMKQQLCHGDPNPGNILLRDNEAVIIDWSNASTGNPEADLAEYIVMVRYAVLPPHLPSEVSEFLNATWREASIRIFMEEYERLSGIGYSEVEPWIAPIAARKLSSDISEEERNLLVNEIRRSLHNGTC